MPYARPNLEAMHSITCRSDIPRFLQAFGLNNRIAEIGVRYGYHLEQLLSCRPALAIGVDHYSAHGTPGGNDTGLDQEELNRIYRETTLRFLYRPEVRIIRENSKEAARMFPRLWFDYVYVDADHTYEGCLADLRNWWPRVRQGGFLGGHDYLFATAKDGVVFGVVEAVRDFLRELDMDENSPEFHFTPQGYRSWMLCKVDGE